MAITLPFTVPHVFRTHKKKTIAAVILLVLLGFGIWRLTRPKQPQYITAVAARSDLRQTVEAVGTVTVHIRRLREKLEDDPSDPMLVLTVGRAGYRMVREDELG